MRFRASSPHIPTAPTSFPRKQEPTPLPSFPRRRESRPIAGAKRPHPPLPITGEDADEADARGYCGTMRESASSFLRRQESSRRRKAPQTGLTPRLPTSPRPMSFPRTRNLLGVSVRERREPTPSPSAPRPRHRHSRAGGNLAPKTSAHSALKSAHSALTERSNGAHGVLKRRSFGAHERSPPSSLPPPAPEPIRGARARSLTPNKPNSFRAFPKPRAPL